MHAARKVGAVAVPLNYRLTPEEAQYVVDNSDAVMAYVDAEYAPLFAQIRAQIPKVREVLVYDGAAARGPARRRRADRAPRARRSRRLEAAGAERADDDLHLRHHRQAEGRGARRAATPSSPPRCCS